MLLIVLLVAGMRFVAPDLFLTVFAPVLRTGTALQGKIEGFASGFGDARTLASMNERLASENAVLSVQNRMLSEHIADLSTLLGSETTPHASIVAGVLSRPPESPYDTLVVNGGTKNGVTLGMEAFGAGGTPLGVVTAVTTSFARITLFSAPGQQVSGWVGKNRAPLTLKGLGAGAFTATVSRAANAVVGDGVYLPGPGALLVGTVTALETDPASPGVTLVIHPVLNPFSIPWVTLTDTGAAFRTLQTASSTTP